MKNHEHEDARGCNIIPVDPTELCITLYISKPKVLYYFAIHIVLYDSVINEYLIVASAM